MTRQECEKLMLDCFEMAIRIYHQYNPDGNNLNMSYNDGVTYFFNEYWEADSTGKPGLDVQHPIKAYSGMGV